jgi:hypothetical protein
MAATQALVQSNTNDGTERAAPTTDGPLRRQRPWHHRRRGHAHGREGESPRRPATARRDTTSARSRSRAAGRGTTRCSRSSTPPATLYHRTASHTCSYLASVREAHAHLASRGYRNMRFLRFLFKKKAVGDSCDMLVPRTPSPSWATATGAPPAARSIKRRFCGPNKRSSRSCDAGSTASRCARLGVQDVGPGQQHVDADEQHGRPSWSATGTDGWSRGRSRRFTR